MNLKLSIPQSPQFYAGLAFLVIGAAALAQSETYEVGTANEMGPGYFPSRLAMVLIVMGIGGIAQAVVRPSDETISFGKLLPLVSILVGMTAFGLLIDSYGLLAAVFALVFISCADRLRRRPLEVLVIAIVLSAMTGFLFIYLLTLPIKLY